MKKYLIIIIIITGHHVYKDAWTPTIGEELCCEREANNPHDAVNVVKNMETVVRVLRASSRYMTYILANRGKITVEVTCNGENSRGNGLEVPEKYVVKGPYHSAEK